MRRATSTVVGSIGLVTMFFLAACGGTASGSPGFDASTATPSPKPLVFTAQATVNGHSTQILTDAKGFTLYFFTSDTLTQIACSGACAKSWPPLTTTTGYLNTYFGAILGLVNGPNGKQVTLYGHPLYRYAGDKAAGDVHGEDVGGVWFVANVEMNSLVDSASATVHTGTVTVGGKSVTVLTDAKGLTLYYFTPDTALQGSGITCTGSCAQTWPPLLPAGVPMSDHGLPGHLSTQYGPNGVQATYNGHPLYRYAGDKAATDANGEGLLGKWFVVMPDLTTALYYTGD